MYKVQIIIYLTATYSFVECCANYANSLSDLLTTVNNVQF